MVDMRFKDQPDCLVNINRLSNLSFIKPDEDCLRIGALTTIRELEANHLIKTRFRVLWNAAHQFASLQIRNAATIGGNIARASPAGETLAPLLTLEAKARFVTADGEQLLPLERFFLGPGRTALGAGGLLTGIEVPYPDDGARGVYLKHAVRGPMDIVVVGVATTITFDGRSAVNEARIGLAAVGPTPMRARGSEQLLQGKHLDLPLIEEAARGAAEEAKPISDHRASAEYRRWIVESLTRRALTQAWQNV